MGWFMSLWRHKVVEAVTNGILNEVMVSCKLELLKFWILRVKTLAFQPN